MMTRDPSLEEIATVLEGASVSNGNLRACCPVHGGDNDSALSISYQDGKPLVTCWTHGCKFEQIWPLIKKRLGQDYKPDKITVGNKSKNRKPIGSKTWPIRNVKGEIIAHHVRLDFEGGGKLPFWKDAKGNKGLGGLKSPELPLYGSEKLLDRPEAPVVLTEGEKAADAAQELMPEYVALGTVTGAETIPSKKVLKSLKGRDVVLWPDNDPSGLTHMQRIAQHLDGARWLEWEEAPEKGDAADYEGDPAALEEMIGAVPGSTPRGKHEKPPHDALRDWWLEDFPNMAYSGGDWWSYGDGIWRRVDPVAVESQIISVAQGVGAVLTGHLVGSVMRLCRAAVYLPADIWDQNPEILVCENGTLNLDTLELKPWEQSDYVTSRVPYAYDPEAEAAVFEALLNDVIPESVELVQEFAGYCLTTDTEYETALWFKGPRGCGKSTVMEGLQAMLGPRSGVLGLAEIESSPFALAKIPGKTLLTSTEQPASYLKSTHVIDALISGETLMVDRKYRDAEEVKPVAKVLWAMNDLPRIGNTTSGIFRRIKIVEFPPLKRERDPNVKRLVREEGAGILNWALRGLERLRERDEFLFPKSVLAATEAFEASNDIPAQFVREECIRDEESQVSGSHLYTRYREWCLANGHGPQSNGRVSEDWRRLGFERRTLKGRNFWKGLKLRGPE